MGRVFFAFGNNGNSTEKPFVLIVTSEGFPPYSVSSWSMRSSTGFSEAMQEKDAKETAWLGVTWCCDAWSEFGEDLRILFL